MEPYPAEDHEVRDPLLASKHETANDEKVESTHVSILPENGSFTFHAGERPYRDSIFTYLFLGTILITYGVGIFAFTHADFTLDSKLRDARFNPASNQCEVLENRLHPVPSKSMWPEFAEFLPILAFLAAFPAGLFLFWLLRRYTRGVLLVSSLVMPLLIIGFCVFWFTWCYGISDFCAAAFPVELQIFYGVFFLGLPVLLIYKLWKSWSANTFEASFQLLKMATDALQQHFSLVVVLPALFLWSLVLVNGPIFTFIWAAFYNGKIVPDFDGAHDHAGYPRCIERAPEWFTAYYTLAGLTAFWVFTVTIQLLGLVVSCVTAQWYFAPTGSTTNGNIMRSLRIVFGPSFGTACNLGTIITSLVVVLLGLLKRVTTRVANSNREGLISVFIQRCVAWMFEFPMGSARYVTNFVAISGSSFWESSKKTSGLLRRNSLFDTETNLLLSTQRVLVSVALIYSLLQSLAVYGVLEWYLLPRFMLNFLSAEFCYLASFLGLTILSSLPIASVIDTVYVCYALEKDTGDISKPEVCRAFLLLTQKQTTSVGGAAAKDKLNAV